VSCCFGFFLPLHIFAFVFTIAESGWPSARFSSCRSGLQNFLFLFVLLAPGARVIDRRLGGVSRAQGHPPQEADCFSTVPSGSSHRECCQAKAFSAHPDLIFFHVSKGARRPEILLSARGSVGTRRRLGSWSQHH
jgi:hypothetical protein